jgi:hypothetical protein
MNDSTRDEEVENEEVEKESTQTMLTEPSNPASIEMRLCAGRISLLQAKVHDLQKENRLLTNSILIISFFLDGFCLS